MLRWIAHVVFGLLAVSPLQAAESGACREIEAKYDATRRQLTSLEINQTLFLATDTGCEGLARRLLDEGASLLAKDRLGAMPLSHAAREGRVNLIGLYLDRGAAIDARNLFGATAL
jgi:ankyrin repeat protein